MEIFWEIHLNLSTQNWTQIERNQSLKPHKRYQVLLKSDEIKNMGETWNINQLKDTGIIKSKEDKRQETKAIKKVLTKNFNCKWISRGSELREI